MDRFSGNDFRDGRPRSAPVRRDINFSAAHRSRYNFSKPSSAQQPAANHTRKPSMLSKLKKLYKKIDWHDKRVRAGALALLALFVSTIAIPVISEYKNNKDYDLKTISERFLDPPKTQYSDKLQYNSQSQSFLYNDGYKAGSDYSGDSSTPKFSAEFFSDPKKGVKVTDPGSSSSVSFKPKFNLKTPLKDQNRLVYPLENYKGQNIYTLKASGIKEDIILAEYSKDSMELKYDLDIPDGLEPRLEQDGSMGIYGAEQALLGQVSTGSPQDEALLKKARDAAEKNNLLFRVPAPFVMDKNKRTSTAKAWYSLKDKELTVHVGGLKNATFPLSIDPSVYVETASKLMRGNNESNIDFDVDNELIQKGKTTGGRFDSWASTLALPSARWNHATAVAGGYIYVVGGNSGSSASTTVYWAKFNTSTGAIEATNPGAGACSNWCNSSSYDLPSAREAASLVAYNGYLYLLGGKDSGGSRTNTVYIAKLGANGEPSLWHPTGGTPVYWYSSTTTLPDTFSFSAAAAYNNRLYIVGGQTGSATTGSTTVQYTSLKPTGDISSWSSTGMTQLSSGAAARYGHTIQIYNDRMYVIGGSNTSAAPQSTVYYVKMASDGTMSSSSWISGTSFTTARTSWGGSFSAIWGGYIYISGGCSAVNGSGYCTTIQGDTQLASINADGSITDWTTIASVTSSRIGYGLVAWRNSLYGIGGCTAQNTSTGACTTTATLTEQGSILTDGEASTVNNSVPSGTSPCVTTGWTQCDLPPLGNGNGQGGQLAGGTIINNGYVYYIGGCYSVGNNSVCYTGNAGKASDTIFYSSIASDGSLTRTSTCTGTFSGSWCVDNTNTINGSNGLAAFGYTVFNNVIYVIGGTDGTTWQSTVWRNPLNADGTLGSWSTQTFAAVSLGAYKGYPYVFARSNPGSAGTYPGNLYVIGGCGGLTAADNGLDCNGTLYGDVYKCYIKTDGSIETTGSPCTTTGQTQLDSEPGTGGSQGLGVMAGTVYANYIYLIGGQSPNESERGEVMYAKIDNSNNIVDADGETATNNIWQTSANSISPVRRRSVSFGYNGYLYTLAGYNVSQGGSLNDLLFAKINVSDGSIGAFYQSTVTVTARWDLRAIVNNGYVYTLGGCSTGAPPASCTGTTATVQTFQLYNNYSGSPKAYSATGLYGNGSESTSNRIGLSSAILNGYIYIAGGCISATDTNCSNATSDVQYAPLNTDGTVGTWANASNILPADRAWGQLEVAGGNLYYLGGQNDAATAQSAVYYASSFSSGNINTAWSTTSGGVGDTNSQAAQARTRFSATTWNDRIYVVGGLDSGGTSTATVYVSPQLTSGGNIAADSWTSSTSINVARSGLVAVAYANNLYIFGGYDGSNYLNDSQYASIGYKTGTISQSTTTVTGSGTSWTSAMVGKNIQYPDGSTATISAVASGTSMTVSASKTVSAGTIYSIQDGSVGSWSYTTSMPLRLRGGDGFAANGFMYIINGRSADTTCNPKTLVAPISANTTISSGNNPTGVGEWYETNVKYSDNRYGAAVSYNEGRAYILGGGCGATLTYSTTNRVMTTVMQSQPQIAKYSRMIDTDTDVFPTKWLMNGLDNSIGAKWYMTYRSSTAANAAWGQDTNFGEVSLGVPQTYTAKDGSGTNTNYARYYYMNVTIDSQKAYGYPEDVTRGPTIADLSLFFTSDPSKRLRHGKTFTGGELQPLDTPF